MAHVIRALTSVVPLLRALHVAALLPSHGHLHVLGRKWIMQDKAPVFLDVLAAEAAVKNGGEKTEFT